MMLPRKLNRIRKMSAHEIMSRCQSLAHGWQDRVALVLPRKQKSCDFESVARACGTLIPGFSPSEISTLAQEFPDSRAAMSESILSASEQVMKGKIDLLGRTIDVAAPDWHQDPLSDFRWPEKFYGDVQIYEQAADVKYVWELSRHQFLPTLAQAWLLSADDSYADRAQRLMASWIEKNPLYVGVNWTSGLEVALRSISWVWTIAGLRTWNGWEQTITDQLARSLADHAHYLSRHLSWYSSPYNHLIGEASALYLLSFVLDDHLRSRRWRELGHQVLTDHGPRQFYDDGFTVEQATGYHFFTLGFFFQAILVGRQFGDPVDGLEKTVERAAMAGEMFRRPNGQWPAVGDLDSARSIPCGHTDFWNFSGLCGLAGAMFENDMLAAHCNDSDVESFWLLGIQGFRWQQSNREPDKSTRGILPSAGYACWSNPQGDWVMLDCGPIGDGVHADETASVAHGHDDALSVHLALEKKNILHDSGMLRYAGSRDWVDYLRSESAHNRIIVDGVSGAKNAGRLAWSHVRQQTELSAQLGDEAAFLRGSLQLSAGVTIERHLFIRNHVGLWIVDFVKLDRPRKVDWHWHLPRETGLDMKSSAAVEGNAFQLRSWCSGDFETNLFEACEGNPQAWSATGYGNKVNGFLVRQQVASDATTLLMVTHLGNPAVRVKIGMGDTESTLFDPDLPRQHVPESIEALRWELLSPVQETYPAGAANRDGVTI